MPFDSMVMAAVAHELSQTLADAKIIKIHQPDRVSLSLKLWNRSGHYRLLLSAHPSQGRAHLSREEQSNPQQPPLFCMVLRKHLEGGRIQRIAQRGTERILDLYIDNRDETGLPIRRLLSLEVMGKHSNILLIDPENHTILDGIRRYSHNVSRYREVLPGRPYLPPPAQSGIPLAECTEEGFSQALLTADET